MEEHYCEKVTANFWLFFLELKFSIIDETLARNAIVYHLKNSRK